jgi:hypothetical protein
MFINCQFYVYYFISPEAARSVYLRLSQARLSAGEIIDKC